MNFRRLLYLVACVFFLNACGLFIKKIPSGEIPDKKPFDHMIDVNGIRYHYTEYPGPGKKMVLLHGFASSTYTWEEVAMILNKEGFHVYALDIKGYGWSDKPIASTYDLLTLTEDVNGWMAVMGIEKAVMVGNSMGGSITALMSTRHPKRIDKMVLIDPGGYPMPLPLVISLARLPMSAFFSKLIFGPWIVRVNLKEVMFDKTKVTEKRVDEYFKRMQTENALNVQIKTARSINFGKDDFAKEVTVGNTTKTLIIWGKNDTWIPLETVGYRFRKDLVNSTLSVIPECGHIPQEEKPEETARLILDFMNDRPITDDRPAKGY